MGEFRSVSFERVKLITCLMKNNDAMSTYQYSSMTDFTRLPKRDESDIFNRAICSVFGDRTPKLLTEF